MQIRAHAVAAVAVTGGRRLHARRHWRFTVLSDPDARRTASGHATPPVHEALQ
jgi:hypothetical protein